MCLRTLLTVFNSLFYVSLTVAEPHSQVAGTAAEAVTCAVSGHFSVASKELELTASNPRHCLLKAEVDKASARPVYRSAVFTISYQQEEVELRDAVAYTLHVPLSSTALVRPSSLGSAANMSPLTLR